MSVKGNSLMAFESLRMMILGIITTSQIRLFAQRHDALIVTYAESSLLPFIHMSAFSDNMNIHGEATLFQTKLEQATEILVQLAHHFVGMQITVVCDSWFGNNGLFKPIREYFGNSFHLLSRLHCNTVLYAMAPKHTSGQRVVSS
jgi:hypothetical protein